MLFPLGLCTIILLSLFLRFSTLKDNTVEYNTKETQNHSKINQELENSRELLEEPVYPSIDTLVEDRIE